VWVYDESADGLALLVLPSGVRTFYFCKRIAGRYRRVKIGRFPGVTIEQARREVAKLTGKVASGDNPADERRQARAAMTFGELFTMYLEKYAKPHKRTWAEDEKQYQRYLKQWAGRRLDQITRGDVAAMHARVGKDAPFAANRALALVSKIFNYAADTGFPGDNPGRRIKRFAEQSRERFIGPDELPRFLAAVEAEENPTLRDYIKLVLFTGQRRENVASMRWDEIDFNRKVWTIPPEKFKSGKAVEVPLVSQVVDVLRTRQDAAKAEPHGDARDEYVFPNRRSKGNVPYLAEPKLAMSRVCERAEITGVRLHDLRRTLASWATMQGVPYPVVARMVGHKAQGVTSIYARFDLQAVRDGFERTVNAMLATMIASQSQKAVK